MRDVDKADLEELVEALNKATDSPANQWTEANGELIPNVGNSYLEWKNEEVSLRRVEDDGGSITVLGYTTLEKLYARLETEVNSLERRNAIVDHYKDLPPRKRSQ